ncbi:hypothetical protein A1356_19190 [Methylomonas koyamae]|uniref:Uncharacterized protein n=1 Tax=Methylomonas koyamae TaxID=702114 RepID=A0AA91I3Q3_9GAMM|nr:hypothetical protein A1356_19190 [Methylomonas koyamae]
MVLLPFQSTNDWKISSPQDITVAPLSSNKGYTLLGITFPASKSDDLEIVIEKAISIGENREGKAKINLNLDYPFITQSQRDILELSFSHSQWDIDINLSAKYEDDEVSKSPSVMRRISDTSYEVLSSDLASLQKKEIWLVFPNAQQKALDTAKLILSILIGIITSLFQLPIIKDRKLPAVLLVFITSLSIVGLSAYYAIYLSRGFELAVWAATFIPHALIALGGAIYVLIARHYQASIGVSVLLDNAPIEFCEVILLGKKGNNWESVEKIERLINGNNVFNFWLRKKYSSYKVSAKSTRSDVVESSEFQPNKGAKQQISPLKLVTK